MPLSTREPQIGETLTIVGFRFPDSGSTGEREHIDGIPVAARGDLYTAAGRMQARYLYRDRVMSPFPSMEIACGSLGGMSGGPVIDQFGAVVAILSAGWSDGQPPSNGAWIIHALMFAVNLVWPPGLYEPETPVLDLPDDLITIVGRENIQLTGLQEVAYTPWH